MNVADLILELSKFEPETPVVIDVNGDPHELLEIDKGKLTYKRPFGTKLIFEDATNEVVFLGNIGNTDYSFENTDG